MCDGKEGGWERGFTKGKACLMIAFNEMTGLTDNGRAVDVVYLDFSKTLDAVYHNILIDKTG